MSEASGPDLQGWLSHPSILVGLGAILLTYVLAAKRGVERHHREPVSTTQVVLFGSGLIVIYLALDSPLHDLAENYLFTAHMIQHLLLIMVVPPLLLAGIPGWMLSPLVVNKAIRGVLYWLTRPLQAFIFFNLVFAFSHVPFVYDVVLASPPLHIGEHLLFLATAILMWWPILSPMPELPRISYPLQVFYVFLQTIPGAAVGAMITLAERPLYRLYAEAPRIWGLSALADQQTGGALMWIGGSAYFLGLATVIFFVWSHREGAHAAA